jgi:hypothetical protein
MTVIAWSPDTLTLASDSRCADGSDNTPVRKIWRLRNGYLFGGAGDAGFCSLVRHWLEKSAARLGHADAPERPEIYGNDPPSFIGLLISPEGTCFILDHYLGPIETLGGPQAVGSGASHAMALMRNGMDSAQAVRRIIEQDLADGVGGETQTLTLRVEEGKSKSCS